MVQAHVFGEAGTSGVSEFFTSTPLRSGLLPALAIDLAEVFRLD
ncbi:MAG: hypothetical protein U5S82_10410 [Gammaproteobacteria bacterium]|nr:hypothetical protein [Gammaproteobacteria bacterium]